MNLEEHLKRQIAFSRATFGPGERTDGVIDHIRKELVEIQKEVTAQDRAAEWVDVVILALDGLNRALVEVEIAAGTSPSLVTRFAANNAVAMIAAKQGKNEMRDWPDWRGMSPDKAIEHDRTKD